MSFQIPAYLLIRCKHCVAPVGTREGVGRIRCPSCHRKFAVADRKVFARVDYPAELVAAIQAMKQQDAEKRQCPE